MILNQVDYRNETFAAWMGKIGQSIYYGTLQEKEQILSSAMSLLDEDYNVHYEYVLVKPESVIYEVLNEFILQCHQHGFMRHFESIYFPYPPIIEPEDPRRVLTMYMLSAGFYLWLITIAVACLVFVGEHVVRYYSRTRHLPPRSEVEIFYDELEEEKDVSTYFMVDNNTR